MGERRIMKIHHYILLLGGLLLTLNVIYPPMIYENYRINDGYKTARHLCTTTRIDRVNDDTQTGKFTYVVKLNVSRFATQGFIIIGIMCIALGATIPKDDTTPTTK